MTAKAWAYRRIFHITNRLEVRIFKTLTAVAIAAAFSGATLMSSCNKDSSSSDYSEAPNLAVRSFSLSRSNTVTGLDSAYFSIDLEHGVIFNADSLHKGTEVNKVVANITFGTDVNKAVITMTGGNTRTGTIDYRKNPSDSIDFTGDVTLTVGAKGLDEERTYRIKVNVHKQITDSLHWDSERVRALPSRNGKPVAQKTVTFKEKAVCLLTEADGSYTMASSEDLLNDKWDSREATFPFTPDIETLEASEDALYILSDRGELYTSTDMQQWSATGRTWNGIIGGYLGSVIGVRAGADGNYFDQYPQLNLAAEKVPADFPTSGASNFVTLVNKWTSSPVAFLAGGALADGKLSDITWAFDGTDWVQLGQGGIPAIEGASIIPYYAFRASKKGAPKLQYSVWMLVGGKLSSGEFNRTVYISYDNGVTWNPGAQTLQLPKEMPAMTDCDNVVLSYSHSANLSDAWTRAQVDTDYTVDGDIIYWNCPYIFLIGGYDASHRLYDTIWRGVLARLTFAPVI